MPRLPQRPAQYFIDELLIPDWDPSGALGYDPTASPSDEAFLDVATSLEDVGAHYPTLVVTYSNETSGGETTYDFLTTQGPGQQRDGQLVATARAEDGREYTGDAASYAAVDAEAIVYALTSEVEDVCLRNAQGADTRFSYVGSQPGPDVPDDFDAPPTVRLEDCTVAYGWDRSP